MDYRSIIESKYNRESWLALLHDIFKSRANFRTVPIPVNANSPIASSSVQLGTITLADDNKIAVYEIKLSDSVDIVANRKGIRNLLISDWKMKGCVGAFLFCFRDNESVLRFSYVSSSFQFTEEGKLEKNETDTKRFTYLLGAGHRSRTAIKQFEDLKNSKLMLADLTKAFSIEALCARFFKEYKDNYENIIEYVTGKRMVKVSNKWEEKVIHAPNDAIISEFSWFDDPEKAVRDYVKKLMGRIVFLQFIQKKGWLGVPVGKEWGEGDKEYLQNLYDRSKSKDNFIDGILELLFNDINTKRENDIANPILGHGIKMPYLNGGLFEQDKADECTFRLPKKYLDDLFKFFSSYNFTIDENDPDDAEIGVDPEMLGRIFENLLEDNKDKGAFYTPKEIVQYMCKESLIAYLQTGKDDNDKETIRTFVTTYNKDCLNGALARDVDEKLKNVKICDPAIGSGAFPMGLLKELFACRSAIEGLSDDNAAEIKKHIIQNNIYGVDIEKGAVDIARLRFWLAIIVDEKTPHALPNMDFKIMQGNSLIPTFNGKYVNLSDKLRHVNSSKIRDAKKELFRIQSIFYNAEGDEKKELLVKIKYQILEIVKLQMDYEYKAELERSTQTLDLFNTDIKKVVVDDEKAKIVGQCIRLQQQLQSSARSLNEKAEITIPFFDWKIMFSEVFNNQDSDGRFDIIIANPPYIDSESMVNQGMSDLREYLKKKFKTLSGNWDIYMAFMAFGMDMARICTFITPDKWLSKPFGLKFREVAFKNNIQFVTRAGNTVFENVTVDAIITMFSGKPAKLGIYQYDAQKEIEFLTAISPDALREPYLIDYLFSEHRNLIERLDKYPNTISMYAKSEGACATSDAYNLKPLIYDNPSPNYDTEYIVVNTGTIGKFAHRWGNSQFTYLGDKYTYPVVNRKKFESQFGKTYIRRSASPKLIFKGLNLLDACLDLEGRILPGKSTMTLCSKDTELLKFLCGLLNSKLFIFYIKKKYMSSSYCGGITFTSDMIDYLPIPEVSLEIQNSIVYFVDKILEKKAQDYFYDGSQEIEAINQIVYKLYELTPDDIRIVENG